MVRRVRRRRVQEIDILFVCVISVITCVLDRLSLEILSRTRCDTYMSGLVDCSFNFDQC